MRNIITENKLRRIIRSEIRSTLGLNEIFGGKKHGDLSAMFIYHAVKENMLCPIGMETFSDLVGDGGKMGAQYARCWLPSALESMKTAGKISEFVERHPEYSDLVR